MGEGMSEFVILEVKLLVGMPDFKACPGSVNEIEPRKDH